MERFKPASGPREAFVNIIAVGCGHGVGRPAVEQCAEALPIARRV